MNNAETFTLNSIGTIRADGESFRVELKSEYAPALEGLEGFSHIQLLYWFDRCDNDACRSALTLGKPYTPSVDRVEEPEVPEWCKHWPKCMEDSGDFDWEAEFNF